jgi:hypothetical protein
MSILGTLFGSAAAEPIAALGTVIDKVFTSDDEREQARAVLAKIAQQPHILQAEINKIEAAHRSIFVAGWRPFIGWVCGAALGYSFIARDLIAWVMSIQSPGTPLPPELAMENLITVLVSLLGLGGLRTIEKLQGRAK